MGGPPNQTRIMRSVRQFFRNRTEIRTPFSSLAATAFCGLSVASMGCAGAAILFALSSSNWCSAFAVVGTAFGISCAAMVAGSLVGFLFGIPRTLQHEDGRQEATRYLANTNLEQISDWLTKILVGVGLTQLSKIPGKIWSLAESLAPGLGSLPGSAGFALILLGFFSVAGFLWGYLWTRIYFRRVLVAAESDTVSRAELNATVEENAGSSTAYSLAASSLAMEDANPKKGASLKDALRALVQHPEHFHIRTVAILLGRLYRELGDLDGAIAQLDKSLLLRRERQIPAGIDDADLLFNKACYLNLKSRQMQSPEESKRLRGSALATLKLSIALKRENAVDATTDSDLTEVVEMAKHDPELKNLSPHETNPNAVPGRGDSQN